MDVKELIHEIVGTLVVGCFLVFVICFILYCFYGFMELSKDILEKRKHREAWHDEKESEK